MAAEQSGWNISEKGGDQWNFPKRADLQGIVAKQ